MNENVPRFVCIKPKSDLGKEFNSNTNKLNFSRSNLNSQYEILNKVSEFSNTIPSSYIVTSKILNSNLQTLKQDEEYDINKTLTDDDLSYKSESPVKLESVSNLNILEKNDNLNLEIKDDHEESFLSDGNNLSLKDDKVNGKNDNFNQGRWHSEEHLKFIEAMYLYGNEWKKVQEYIGTRSSTQARSHAQKFFIRLRKKFACENLYDEDTIQKKSDKIMAWIKEFITPEVIMKHSKVNYYINRKYRMAKEEKKIQQNCVK